MAAWQGILVTYSNQCQVTLSRLTVVHMYYVRRNPELMIDEEVLHAFFDGRLARYVIIAKNLHSNRFVNHSIQFPGAIRVVIVPQISS